MKAQLTQPSLCYTNPHVALQSRKKKNPSSSSCPPALFLAEHQSKAVNQPVQQQCAQVLAALAWAVESPESPDTWAVLLGEAHINSSPLALILSESTEQVCVIWHFNLWRVSIPTCSRARSAEARVNLPCRPNLEDSLKLWDSSLLRMSVSSTVHTMPKHTKFICPTRKQQTVPGSLFLDIISSTIWQQQYLVSPPKRPPSFCDPHFWLVTFRGLNMACVKFLDHLLPRVKRSMQTF